MDIKRKIKYFCVSNAGMSDPNCYIVSGNETFHWSMDLHEVRASTVHCITHFFDKFELLHSGILCLHTLKTHIENSLLSVNKLVMAYIINTNHYLF